MNYEKTDASLAHKNTIQRFWNERIMERFIKANLFIICCVAAGLLLIVYLAAFSCEVSWILEAHGDLPVSAYILCTQYFIVFVATTILIHGLVTGLSWGLFAWSVVIGLLSIPELIFVMVMTTQHWGLQSVHGLTELISYLIRLVINCFALICVIPTGLRWRRELQVLAQLQDLATRLQLQTPPPSVPMTKADSRRSSKRHHGHQHELQSAFENAGYQVSEPNQLSAHGLSLYCAGNGMLALGAANNHNNNTLANNNNPLFGSQNEFNASIFAPTFAQYIHSTARAPASTGHRAQSLMDLRCTLPGMYNPRYVLDTEDKNAKYFNITVDDLKNSLQDSSKPNQTPSLIGSTNNDPIYCSIESKPVSPQAEHRQQRQPEQAKAASNNVAKKSNGKLVRNCISLENLDGISKVQNDFLSYGNNLVQNYTQQQQCYLAMLSGYLQPQQAAGNLMALRRPSTSSSISVVNYAGPPIGHVQPMQRRHSQQLQYYSGFGYANYANPYITANSKLSLGNESDDYRKYRDVAL